MNRNRFNRTSNAAQKQNQSHRRSGSILLVVVALMGMMAFLGFVIYTFAAQERINSLTFETITIHGGPPGSQVGCGPSDRWSC